LYCTHFRVEYFILTHPVFSVFAEMCFTHRVAAVNWFLYYIFVRICRHLIWILVFVQRTMVLYSSHYGNVKYHVLCTLCLKKTVQNCFCHKFDNVYQIW